MLSRIAIPTLAALVLAAACSESPASRSLSPAGTASLRDKGPGNSENGDNGDGGDRVQNLRLRDDCDPTSFNAALGAGACVGNGGTTLAEFNAELAKNHFVGAWKMNPDHFGGIAGTVIEVTNRGGETHTFTPVVAFGGGIVPSLNQASGNTTVAPECANLNPQTIVPSGGHLNGSPLAVGTHRFQCCIHPWMRTTATITAG
jgi:hypothetical protein